MEYGATSLEKPKEAYVSVFGVQSLHPFHHLLRFIFKKREKVTWDMENIPKTNQTTSPRPLFE